MPKPVLQTKQVGQAPHYSRHPLAPPEIVYQCEEHPGFWARLAGLSWGKKLNLAGFIAGMIGLPLIFVGAVRDIAQNGMDPETTELAVTYLIVIAVLYLTGRGLKVLFR